MKEKREERMHYCDFEQRVCGGVMAYARAIITENHEYIDKDLLLSATVGFKIDEKFRTQTSGMGMILVNAMEIRSLSTAKHWVEYTLFPGWERGEWHTTTRDEAVSPYAPMFELGRCTRDDS